MVIANSNDAVAALNKDVEGAHLEKVCQRQIQDGATIPRAGKGEMFEAVTHRAATCGQHISTENQDVPC